MNQKYIKAQKITNKHFDLDIFLKFGTIENSVIDELEYKLNVHLPISYKLFLSDFGFGGAQSYLISGLRTHKQDEVLTTGIGWKTTHLRTNFNLPHHIIPISDIGDGSYYALDLSQMNADHECPVVVWPIGGYDETPELEIVAPDFGTWFLEQVEEQIRQHNEQNQSA